MKLKTTTLLLVLLALILGGFVYYYEIKNKKQQQLATQTQLLVNFQEKDVTKLTIEKQDETLEFERNKGEAKSWHMKQPEDILASNASISFLLNSLVEAKSDRPFTISSNQQAEYGLEPPLATITITLENQEQFQIKLGKPNFDDTKIYAQVEPETVILVDKSLQYAVERELTEWKEIPAPL